MIKEHSYIHPEAKIGKHVEIAPFVIIQKEVEIGEGTSIGSHAIIYSGSTIGKKCKIFPGAMIGSDPLDLKYNGAKTFVEVGDHTIIREFVTLSRGTQNGYMTKVGCNCLIMPYIHVGHDTIIGNHCILAPSVQIGGHVHIDDYVVIGAKSGLHQFVKIGKHVMIAGGSIILKDIPPYLKVGKRSVYYGVNTVGLKRRGYDRKIIHKIQDIYRHLLQKGLPLQKALKEIERDQKASEVTKEIISFIQKSERGILKSRSI